MDEQDLAVGAAAELTGISIRALHHYDRLALLQPSGRTFAGHRHYSTADLPRLHRIAIYREVGTDMDRLAGILADPTLSDEDHLRRQRGLVTDRVGHLQTMLQLIDKELEALAAGQCLPPRERRAIVGDTRFTDDYTDARKGGAAWLDQELERQRHYTEDDWTRQRDERNAIDLELVNAMRDGVPATHRIAMDIVERLRLHTDRWHYDCDHDTQLAVDEMSRANSHVSRNFDFAPPGLDDYRHEAIAANHRRATATAAGRAG
jgi:MerR family transcriptional regulator, thiopeptide resistance regulator